VEIGVKQQGKSAIERKTDLSDMLRKVLVGTNHFSATTTPEQETTIVALSPPKARCLVAKLDRGAQQEDSPRPDRQ